MPEEFEVVIIGAGPAGLMAGLAAVRHGLSVAILEKDTRIGYPLHCGEAVTRGSIESVIEVNPGWIKARIERGKLVSPSGYTYVINHPRAGYVLDRPRMERDLADDFERLGGKLFLNHHAARIISGSVAHEAVAIRDSSGNDRLHLQARVFIAADGVEGTMARSVGIDNRLDLSRTESFLQYRLRNIVVEPDIIEIHLGSKVAPRSYLWLFPKGSGEANVGLGVPGDRGSEARFYLDRFVEQRFPTAEIVFSSCGTSPRYQGPAVLADKNLLVTGDAARVLDSVTGAGIVNAMLSGKLAGEAAAGWCRQSGDNWRDLHRLYPGRFLRTKHRLLFRYRQIKELLDRLTDDDMDEIVQVFDDVIGPEEVDEVNPLKLFWEILRKKPRLLKLARHYFRARDGGRRDPSRVC
ncbi:MAG: NAD(P)/FAD-dependent oxidoreductase [Candidatus Zixiibacteriota bacterium]|nr:MAG: NAD(P)/FAD-dependent oxidoreductase [candidate division Zixibacteria bacterium]